MCTLHLTILHSRATTAREGTRNRTRSSIRTRIITRIKGTSKKNHRASIRKKEENMKAAGSEEEHRGVDTEEEGDQVEVGDISEGEVAS